MALTNFPFPSNKISLYNKNVGSPVFVKLSFQKQFPAGVS